MQEIMDQLPSVIGAEVVKERKPSFLSQAYYTARFKIRNWPVTITLSSLSTKAESFDLTTVKAAYVCRDNFSFSIANLGRQKPNFLTKAIWGQVDPELGEDIVAKNDDSDKFRALFKEQKMKDGLHEIFGSSICALMAEKGNKNTFSLTLSKKYGYKAWDEQVGFFKAAEEFFEEVLSQLVEIDSATEEVPNIKNVSGML
ncbi:MAG: hypothetical protein KGH61_04070 [Candidatus Micrarchaeota archaeon]|nr:hypothetical protein [Candidatus Micrarchaeota archaeon]MDE1848097.1 hypothetical protein [Candidatus Micrarchaeota archaeon]MDE1864775.1 hypothetical protein [Candidatus Micrarchaeota archaeon]